MPEGHSIFLYAREHRKLFADRVVIATSPQGRFARGAERLSGRKLLGVDTHGKHLFYRWHRAETLHIHLGLYGKFRTFGDDPPLPTPGTRLALHTEGTTVYLAGPTVCELIVPSEEETIRSRLGPDPLQAGKPGHSAEAFIEKLARRKIPIGASFIDQAVIAGIGNIYRSEALFLTGINPKTPSDQISEDQAKELWNLSVKLLKRGVRDKRIVTVPRRTKERGDGANQYVYKRDRFACRKCGGPISSGQMANRNIWWCNGCQPT